jgi:hypothetical protein
MINPLTKMRLMKKIDGFEQVPSELYINFLSDKA